MYILQKFEYCAGEWYYLNTFAVYSDAEDKLEEIARRVKGTYRIIMKEAC